MGCKRFVEPDGDFKRRKYVAFLLKSSSGAKFAILDSELTGNAIYLFEVGESIDPDHAEWLKLAKKSKREVLNSSQGKSAFLCRIFHSGDWKIRVKGFLERN